MLVFASLCEPLAVVVSFCASASPCGSPPLCACASAWVSVRHGAARRGVVRRCVAWRGMVRCGMARRGA
eukprot:1015658-Alexandrium_andersonii.AAC.1